MVQLLLDLPSSIMQIVLTAPERYLATRTLDGDTVNERTNCDMALYMYAELSPSKNRFFFSLHNDDLSFCQLSSLITPATTLAARLLFANNTSVRFYSNNKSRGKFITATMNNWIKNYNRISRTAWKKNVMCNEKYDFQGSHDRTLMPSGLFHDFLWGTQRICTAKSYNESKIIIRIESFHFKVIVRILLAW